MLDMNIWLDRIISHSYFLRKPQKLPSCLEEDELIQSPAGRVGWQEESNALKTVLNLELVS